MYLSVEARSKLCLIAEFRLKRSTNLEKTPFPWRQEWQQKNSAVTAHSHGALQMTKVSLIATFFRDSTIQYVDHSRLHLKN